MPSLPSQSGPFSWRHAVLLAALATAVLFAVAVAIPLEWLHRHPRAAWLRHYFELLFLYGTLPGLCIAGAMRSAVLARALGGVLAAALLALWWTAPTPRLMHVKAVPGPVDWYEFLAVLALLYLAAAGAGAMLRAILARFNVLGGTTRTEAIVPASVMGLRPRTRPRC